MNFIESPPKIKIVDLRMRAFELLQNNNYSNNSINVFRKIYNLLDCYAGENGIEFYDCSVGEKFLDQCTKYRGKISNGKRIMADTALSVINTLNNILYYDKLKIVCESKEYYCPDCFSDILKHYLQVLHIKGYNPKTINNHYRYSAEFLNLLSKKTTFLKEIYPEMLYEIFKIHGCKCRMSLYVISAFLRFIYKENYVCTDFSKLIVFPKQPVKIPTVYSKDDIQKALQMINLNTVKGKRDYAIILLAYRLGLRSSDIVSLKFENIDFVNKRINLIQIKTKIPLTLPLLPEINRAIREYLKVRPKSQFKEIFLSSLAPFAPFCKESGSTALRKYFLGANVNVTNKKTGLHSLRSTLASELISENVSFAVTQKILGHSDSSSIKYYVKFDIESLRECSLPVPSPSGRFNDLLNCGNMEVR